MNAQQQTVMYYDEKQKRFIVDEIDLPERESGEIDDAANRSLSYNNASDMSASL